MLFAHLAGMDESADARILTAVPQSSWKSSHTFWMANTKNDLSFYNLSLEDATELALDRPPCPELCSE